MTLFSESDEEKSKPFTIRIHGEDVYWDGKNFYFDEKISPFYDASIARSTSEDAKQFQADVGWTHDLTKLHEDNLGGQHPMDLLSRALTISDLERIISNQRRWVILEVGCSSGFLLSQLKKSFSDHVIIGSDFISSSFPSILQRVSGIPLIEIDINRSGLDEASIDSVVALNVLEHIQDDVLALGEIYRILKEHGTVVLEVPACNWLYDDYDAELLHYRRYSMRELCLKCENAGFKVLKKYYVGFFPFPFFAAVKFSNIILSKFRSRDCEENKKSIVESRITSTVGNKVLSLALQSERLIGKYLKFPIGIRCRVVLKK